MTQRQLPEKLVCVQHRRGWCATRKKTTRYNEIICTLCDHYVTAPWGIEFEDKDGGITPDCPECLQRLVAAKKERKK